MSTFVSPVHQKTTSDVKKSKYKKHKGEKIKQVEVRRRKSNQDFDWQGVNI